MSYEYLTAMLFDYRDGIKSVLRSSLNMAVDSCV
jgi:hypothetical protein